MNGVLFYIKNFLTMKNCLECGDPLEGRIDKKFCSVYCKSAYHHKNNKNKDHTLFKQIDQQLKLNRRLLKKYNQSGKTTIRKNILIENVFNPKYLTHYWKAKNGNIYLFCYEYGFMEKKENGNAKYVIVQWQPYMNEFLK